MRDKYPAAIGLHPRLIFQLVPILASVSQPVRSVQTMRMLWSGECYASPAAGSWAVQRESWLLKEVSKPSPGKAGKRAENSVMSECRPLRALGMTKALHQCLDLLISVQSARWKYTNFISLYFVSSYP